MKTLPIGRIWRFAVLLSFCIAMSNLLAIHRSTQVVSDNQSSVMMIQPTVDTKQEASRPEICFITSVYSERLESADRVNDVTAQARANPTFRYYTFTNKKHLPTPGWTKLVQSFPQYSRLITQSRWPKFMAWTLPEMQHCGVIFYMDGITYPNINALAYEFRQVAHDILHSKYGIAQYLHKKGGGPLAEFQRILWAKKDTPDHVLLSIAWLKAQPDFSPNSTLYENRIFGYNPRNPYFQQASTFFWDHYSKEQDSWRDQPLWSYTLQRYGIVPIPLDHKRLFATALGNMGHGGHHYGW
jgi:hypothetical protein